MLFPILIPQVNLSQKTSNNETIAQIFPLGKAEIKTYKELMKEAILDTASPKKHAAIIKASAQL